jgi:SAM-dependent methyltransferase
MSAKALSWEDAVIWLRNQPEQAELVRSCFYDDPLINAAKRYYESTEWQAVRALLLPQPARRALDLGAGRGISAYALARDGWQVDALEPDSSSLVGAGAIRALAKEANLNIQVEQTWGEKLPYADATFDVVHGRQVLHHAHNLKQLCSEAARVLKPGGIFIATREHVISRKEDLPVFLNNHPLHKLYGGEHAYTLPEYKQAISQSGIKLAKVLNPFQTEINTYPETFSALRKRLAERVGLSFLNVPDFVLGFLGSMSNVPGRLYTFVGHKNG